MLFVAGGAFGYAPTLRQDALLSACVETRLDRPGNVITNAVVGGIAEGYTRHMDGTLLGVQVAGGGVVPDHTLDLPQNLASGQAQGFMLTSAGQVRTASVSYDAASLATNLSDGIVAAAYAFTSGQKAGTVNICVNGASCLVLSNGWNEALGVRSNIAWNIGGNVVCRFDLQRGPGTNQITKIVREDGSSREISYDGAGRLAGWKYKNSAGVADYDRSWLYSYDGAGNLISAGRDPSISGGPMPMSPMCRDYATRNIRATSEFTVDDYNFHTVRKWNAVDLVGYAATNATVTVNGWAARRSGERFVVSIPLAASTTAHVTNLTVCSVVSVSTNLEYYFTNSVQLTLPAYPETIETSLAGVTLSDSMVEYLYDSRNQLRRVTDKTGATATRLQSVYDYYPDGRRARKTITAWNGSAWQSYRTCRFIYDQMNLIREVVSNQTGVITRDYTWGLDLAGMQSGQWGQDAGGIGGLLAITEVSGSSTNILLPVCDQVGTVHALVAAVTNNVTLATPAVVARYETTPYGDLISADGPYASSCPFSMNSKYRDSETSVVFFQLRPYDPCSGKWLVNDHLGEDGGLNLTEFTGSDPVNKTDKLGLAADDFGAAFGMYNADSLANSAIIKSAGGQTPEQAEGAIFSAAMANGWMTEVSMVSAPLDVEGMALGYAFRFAKGTSLAAKMSQLLGLKDLRAWISTRWGTLKEAGIPWYQTSVNPRAGKVINIFSPVRQKVASTAKSLNGLVDSSTIRFTQDTAGKNINGIASFKDGRPIKDMVDKFKAAGKWPDDVPPLRVFEKDGLIYTLDNRRLVAAHQAGIKVRIVPATAKEIADESFKCTNPGDGWFIGIKGALQ